MGATQLMRREEEPVELAVEDQLSHLLSLGEELLEQVSSVAPTGACSDDGFLARRTRSLSGVGEPHCALGLGCWYNLY